MADSFETNIYFNLSGNLDDFRNKLNALTEKRNIPIGLAGNPLEELERIKAQLLEVSRDRVIKVHTEFVLDPESERKIHQQMGNMENVVKQGTGNMSRYLKEAFRDGRKELQEFGRTVDAVIADLRQIESLRRSHGLSPERLEQGRRNQWAAEQYERERLRNIEQTNYNSSGFPSPGSGSSVVTRQTGTTAEAIERSIYTDTEKLQTTFRLNRQEFIRQLKEGRAEFNRQMLETARFEQIGPEAFLQRYLSGRSRFGVEQGFPAVPISSRPEAELYNKQLLAQGVFPPTATGTREVEVFNRGLAQEINPSFLNRLKQKAEEEKLREDAIYQYQKASAESSAPFKLLKDRPGFSWSRLNEPGAKEQLGFALLFGGIPSAIGATIGAGYGGTTGALLGSTITQFLRKALDPLKEAVGTSEVYKEAGLSLERSILGITSIRQSALDVVGSNGQPVPLSVSLPYQQQKARDIQLAARSALLPLGIAGQTESTFVQGTLAALASRGFGDVSAEQTKQITRLLGGAIQTQRPQLLDNTQLLLRDLQDLLGGGPLARRTVLSQLSGIRQSLPSLESARSVDQIISILSKSLEQFAQTAEQLDTPITRFNKFTGALDNLRTAGGSVYLENYTPALKDFTKVLKDPKTTEAVKQLNSAMGQYQAGFVRFQTFLIDKGSDFVNWLAKASGGNLGALTAVQPLNKTASGSSDSSGAGSLAEQAKATTALFSGLSAARLKDEFQNLSTTVGSPSPIYQLSILQGLSKISGLDYTQQIALRELLKGSRESAFEFQAPSRFSATPLGKAAEGRARIGELIDPQIKDLQAQIKASETELERIKKESTEDLGKASLDVLNAKKALTQYDQGVGLLPGDEKIADQRRNSKERASLYNAVVEALNKEAQAQIDLKTSTTDTSGTIKYQEDQIKKFNTQLSALQLSKVPLILDIINGLKTNLQNILPGIDTRLPFGKIEQLQTKTAYGQLFANQYGTAAANTNNPEAKTYFQQLKNQAQLQQFKDVNELIRAQNEQSLLQIENFSPNSVSGGLVAANLRAITSGKQITSDVARIKELSSQYGQAGEEDRPQIYRELQFQYKQLGQDLLQQDRSVQELNKEMDKYQQIINSVSESTRKYGDAFFGEISKQGILRNQGALARFNLQEFDQEAKLRELNSTLGQSDKVSAFYKQYGYIPGSVSEDVASAALNPAWSKELQRQQAEEDINAQSRQEGARPLREMEERNQLVQAVEENKKAFDDLTSSVSALRDAMNQQIQDADKLLGPYNFNVSNNLFTSQGYPVQWGRQGGFTSSDSWESTGQTGSRDANIGSIDIDSGSVNSLLKQAKDLNNQQDDTDSADNTIPASLRGGSIPDLSTPYLDALDKGTYHPAKKAQSKSKGSSDPLAWLWDNVGLPVLNAIDPVTPISTDSTGFPKLPDIGGPKDAFAVDTTHDKLDAFFKPAFDVEASNTAQRAAKEAPKGKQSPDDKIVAKLDEILTAIKNDSVNIEKGVRKCPTI